MSYEVATGKKSLGQFASNKGYANLIAAVKRGSYPALRGLVTNGETEAVSAAVAELQALAKVATDPTVRKTASNLAQMIAGKKQIMITDGVS